MLARAELRWPLLKAVLVLGGLATLAAWALRAAPRAAAPEWNALLLPGVALALLSFLAYVLRFRRVMRMLDLELTPRDAFAIASFAVFCQCFVPLGAGADISKYVKLRGLAPQRRALVSAAGIVLEHLLGLAVLVTLSATSFAVLRPFALDVNLPLLVIIACAVVALAAVVLLRRQRGAIDARQLLARLAAHRGDAASAIAWSVLMHLLLAAAVQVGARGLGIAVDYGQVLFVLASANVLQAVPASLVGIGVADVAGTGLYVALGLPLSSALLLVSLLYGYRLLVAAIGGLWELEGARRALRL